MVKIAFALIALFYMQCASALTQVSASVDKNPVMINESLILTVVANAHVNTNELDTSSLHKDFIVGRTSVSSQNKYFNGNSVQTTTWSTLLMPRTSGKFVIPALTLKHLRTQPINIDVIEQSTQGQDKGEAQKIFITSTLSSSEVYVQELVTLTVKLHFSIDLKRGSLSDPDLTDANISQIGEDKEATEIIQGIRYRTIERSYAIHPQKSGDYQIMSSHFEGEIVSSTQRRSSFFSFNESKPIRVRGDNLPIKVRPIPADIHGDWLPSELVTLHQEWQPAQSEFKVGEPITRVLTLTAASVSEEQLPTLEMSVPKGLKVYPDQAQLHSRVNNHRLVSQKIQNFALVASKPGEYKLPEIKVTWWNTVTNQKQLTSIPSETIKVIPNDEWEAQAPTSLPNVPEPVSNIPESITVTTTQASWLQWLFLGLWLVTCLAWYLSNRRLKTSLLSEQHIPKTGSIQVKESNVEKALLKACKQHDGEQVLSLILPWVNLKGAKAITLEDAITFINNTEFTEALLTLQASYFSQSPQQWSGDTLFNLIKHQGSFSQDSSTEDFSLNP